jgi:hypothetical protein
MQIGKALVWGILAAACSSTATAPPQGHLVVSTQSLSYLPGDSVVVRFANLGDQTVVYTTCFAALSRLDNADWVHVNLPSDTLPCRLRAKGLPPGSVDSARLSLPVGLINGVYRYVFDPADFTTFGGPGVADADKQTNAFEVR